MYGKYCWFKITTLTLTLWGGYLVWVEEYTSVEDIPVRSKTYGSAPKHTGPLKNIPVRSRTYRSDPEHTGPLQNIPVRYKR